jgi:DUF2950 family protein
VAAANLVAARDPTAAANRAAKKVAATADRAAEVRIPRSFRIHPRAFRFEYAKAPMMVTIFRKRALAFGIALCFPALLAAPIALAAAGDTPAAPTKPARGGPQQSFASPEDAARALFEAMRTQDSRNIHSVLGRGSGNLIRSGDPVQDAQMREAFVSAYDKSLKFDRDGDSKAVLLLGANQYPFPFPLVKDASGWRFDAKSGAEEILNRRIGRNELAAIQVCLAYVDAQREYATKDRDNNGLLEYAQNLVSTQGTQDGLYWETKEGDPPSPLGPLTTRAKREGYGSDLEAYHGYEYKILTSQGKDAPGGAYDYIVRGKMIGGFALAAYPARWGASGVMTFTCNHDGVVYQKNLGRNTRAVAGTMTQFNPDATWEKATP